MGHLLVEELIDRQGSDGRGGDAVAIGLGGPDGFHADHAVGTYLVFNHDRLAKLRLQSFSHHPREQI